MDMNEREECLQKRLMKKKEYEDEVILTERRLKSKDNVKKQVLLRLAPSLWDQIASWAEDDFRSINSQIEYILSEAIKKRKGCQISASYDTIDE